MREKEIEYIRTTLLNALHDLIRDGPVNGLGGILDGLDGALPHDGGGAQEADLAGDLSAEHCGWFWCGEGLCLEI